MQRTNFKLLIVFLLGLTIPMCVMAATTGKIAGVIKDDQSGEPLPGVNVIIEGTTMGAATDMNGNYFILNIPPGMYTLKTSMIGYEVVSITDVHVQIDRTTTVNAALKTAVLAGEEVTIVSEREVVRKDVAFTQMNFDTEEIESIPATYTLDQALTAQPSISFDDQGLTMRRANSQEISYMLDGMVMKDERTNRPYTGLSTTAISEVQVMTGSITAEYSDARAGVVNVVTRNPGSKYSLNVDAQLSPLWGGDDSDFGGLKHFGPYIFSNDNWYEYGRWDWNGGNAAADRNKDGDPDFEGWNAWAAGNTYQGETLTAEQAFAILAWQHRSEDKDGNLYYDGKDFASYPVGSTTLGSLIQPLAVPGGGTPYQGLKQTGRTYPMNWYGYEQDYNYDVTFSGPVPMTNDKLGFVVSHKNEHSQFPFYLGQDTFTDKSTQAKVLFRPTPSIRVQLTGFVSNTGQAHRGDFSGSDEEGIVVGVSSPRTGSVIDVYDNNDRVFQSDSRLIPRNTKRKMLGLKWTHTVSAKTFYEVQAQGTWIDYRAKPWEKERVLDPVIQIGPIQLTEAPRGWRYQGSPSDILGVYNLGGGRELDLSDSRMLYFRADITSQVNVHHQIKAGFEYRHNQVNELRGYQENWEEFVDPNWTLGPGDQANWHDYTRSPVLGGAYLQDRMEYGGMILTAGLRLDFYQPESPFFDNNDIWFSAESQFWDQHDQYFDAQYETGFYGLPPDNNPPLQVYLSPRLGISHPIGEDSKLYFSYSHLYQMPTFRLAYQMQLGIDEPLEDRPNAWLRMPKAISFEAGFEQRLIEDYVVNIRGWYRDVTRDVVQVEVHSRIGGSPDYAANTLARDVKGVEVVLEKKYGQYFTGFINGSFSNQRDSNFGWEDIRHPDSAEIIRDSQNREDLWIINSYSEAIRFRRGTWELKTNLSFRTPVDYGPGPEFLGAKIFGLWNIQLFHEFEQGGWFSWNPSGLESLEGVDNEQYDNFNLTNLHIEKRFRFGGVTTGLYADVRNLFNVKNGHDADGFASREDRSGAGSEGPNAQAYFDEIKDDGKRFGAEPGAINAHLIQRPYIFWQAPRDIWFGLRFFF